MQYFSGDFSVRKSAGQKNKIQVSDHSGWTVTTWSNGALSWKVRIPLLWIYTTITTFAFLSASIGFPPAQQVDWSCILYLLQTYEPTTTLAENDQWVWILRNQCQWRRKYLQGQAQPWVSILSLVTCWQVQYMSHWYLVILLEELSASRMYSSPPTASPQKPSASALKGKVAFACPKIQLLLPLSHALKWWVPCFYLCPTLSMIYI